MSGGYMGRVPWVDLDTGRIQTEDVDEKVRKDFIGGYGIGARLLYERQKAHTDPLSPEAIFGFYAGPLTGTRAVIGSRFTVMGKSPLTGTWGDANCGGFFGPHMKFAGIDGVFFQGASSTPVYLLVEEGKASLHDASGLWGKTTGETEALLAKTHGDDIAVACIGPSGEMLSLISSVIHDGGRVAGRSGVGAIMGSKQLKAVVVKGRQTVQVADEARLRDLYTKHIRGLKEFPVTAAMSKWGTSNEMEGAIISGDAPVKNWGGSYPADFSDAQALNGDNVIRYQLKKYACWRCPVACGGRCKVPSGPYAMEGHKPEYETLGAFGPLLLNASLESIFKANEICNMMGIDTISAGATIAFAIECFENGLITRGDTDGLELRWGDPAVMIRLLEKMCAREGFGAILADGTKAAAERIGAGADKFAMHIQGQEIAMHDGKLYPGLATSYHYNATPGRHTLACEDWKRPGMPPEKRERYQFAGRGVDHLHIVAHRHVIDCTGLCYYSTYYYDAREMIDYISAVTGWDYSVEQHYVDGERIATMRNLFNIREGQNMRAWKSPGRTVGAPPLTEGPLKDVSLDMEQMAKDYYEVLGWDILTSMPRRETLERLGLDHIVDSWGGANASPAAR